jgi:hypothetical protein
MIRMIHILSARIMRNAIGAPQAVRLLRRLPPYFKPPLAQKSVPKVKLY